MKYSEFDTQISTIFELYEETVRRQGAHFEHWESMGKAKAISDDREYIKNCLNEIWEDALTNKQYEIANRCYIASNTMDKMWKRYSLYFRHQF